MMEYELNYLNTVRCQIWQKTNDGFVVPEDDDYIVQNVTQ